MAFAESGESEYGELVDSVYLQKFLTDRDGKDCILFVTILLSTQAYLER